LFCQSPEVVSEEEYVVEIKKIAKEKKKAEEEAALRAQKEREVTGVSEVTEKEKEKEAEKGKYWTAEDQAKYERGDDEDDDLDNLSDSDLDGDDDDLDNWSSGDDGGDDDFDDGDDDEEEEDSSEEVGGIDGKYWFPYFSFLFVVLDFAQDISAKDRSSSSSSQDQRRS